MTNDMSNKMMKHERHKTSSVEQCRDELCVVRSVAHVTSETQSAQNVNATSKLKVLSL